MKKLLTTIGAAGMTILGASAADYHWTGAAGNRLWSDPGNWEKGDRFQDRNLPGGKTVGLK